MINFAAENIVEPFNRQRKGHANEYKVSTNPHRVQVTAAFWLQSFNPAGTRVGLHSNYIHLWAILDQKY